MQSSARILCERVSTDTLALSWHQYHSAGELAIIIIAIFRSRNWDKSPHIDLLDYFSAYPLLWDTTMSMTSIAIVQSCSTDLQRGRKSSIHDSDKILKKMDLDEECKQQDCLLCAEDDESKVRVRNDNHSLNCKFRQNPHKLIGSKAELSSQSSNDSDDPCISRKSDIAIVHKNGEHTCPGCIVDSRGWDDQIDRAIINLPDEDLRVRKVRFLVSNTEKWKSS